MQRGRIGNRANSFTGERACSVDGQEAVGIAWGELRGRVGRAKKGKLLATRLPRKIVHP